MALQPIVLEYYLTFNLDLIKRKHFLLNPKYVSEIFFKASLELQVPFRPVFPPSQGCSHSFEIGGAQL